MKLTAITRKQLGQQRQQQMAWPAAVSPQTINLYTSLGMGNFMLQQLDAALTNRGSTGGSCKGLKPRLGPQPCLISESDDSVSVDSLRSFVIPHSICKLSVRHNARLAHTLNALITCESSSLGAIFCCLYFVIPLIVASFYWPLFLFYIAVTGYWQHSRNAVHSNLPLPRSFVVFILSSCRFECFVICQSCLCIFHLQPIFASDNINKKTAIATAQRQQHCVSQLHWQQKRQHRHCDIVLTFKASSPSLRIRNIVTYSFIKLN